MQIAVEHQQVYKVESCGTVPNPEKSRLSRPVGQSGLVPKDFQDGTNGTGQFKSFSGQDNIEKN